jgi:nascent polypeptide-associated complex subunit alpha
MPELTELDKATASMTEPRGDGSGSGTESDSDDTIPELEEPGTGQTAGVFPGASATGLPIDMVSKAKQSRGEKKARKIMSKLGLKPVCYLFDYTRRNRMHLKYVILHAR